MAIVRLAVDNVILSYSDKIDDVKSSLQGHHSFAIEFQFLPYMRSQINEQRARGHSSRDTSCCRLALVLEQTLKICYFVFVD